MKIETWETAVREGAVVPNPDLSRSVASDRTPGTPYEGTCGNCGRTIRAAFFIDWQSVRAPLEINVICGCGARNLTVTLHRVTGTVMAVN